MDIFLLLFMSMLKIGCFAFGGGYAIISLLEGEFITKRKWIEHNEFMDVVAIAESTPGPIAINCATYVGYTATGSVWGSLLATIAIVIPSLVIMLSICKVYFVISSRFQRNIYFTRTMHMLRLSVLGMIGAAALLLIKPINQPSVSFIDWRSWVIFVVACIITISPLLLKIADVKGLKSPSSLRKSLQIISNPILLIILSGVVGYLIYA